jgi:hypothetical protein
MAGSQKPHHCLCLRRLLKAIRHLECLGDIIEEQAMIMKHGRKIVTLLALVGLLALAAAAQADTFVLSGNILDVGVSNWGSLPDDYFTAGIVYKPAWPGNDFLGNTVPFEYYSIGVGGVWGTTGWGLSNYFGTTSYNTSNPSFLSGLTASGVFNLNGALLIYIQNIYFSPDSNRINFSADIINAGTVPATDVVYARGLNPQQDVGVGGGSATINSIPAANRVRAVGPLTNLYIDIVDLTGGGVPTVGWPAGPYNLLNPQNLGDGDYTINMAWEIGTLDPGRSYEIDFYYEVGVVPVPPSILLLGTGILGLVGVRGFTRKI